MSLRVLERHAGVLFALLFVPLNSALATLAIASYCLRIIALEGIYHRYFAHRSYRAGRAVQVFLALWGAQTGQRGPLWWAGKHREHHRYVDTQKDPHSPSTHSLWYAHLGWFVDPKHALTDLNAVPELARYRELRWLNRFYLIPLYGVAALLGVAGYNGWLGPRIDALSAVMWGFYVPSFLQIHAIAFVNTLGHMPHVLWGRQRYSATDLSTNRPILALLTLGAGWHNNHHRYASPARAGFAWWEIDITYYVLRLMQALCLIYDVKSHLPDDVRRDGGLPV